MVSSVLNTAEPRSRLKPHKGVSAERLWVGAKAQDLPDRLGQPHFPDSTEALGGGSSHGGCPDKLNLSLKPGRTGWGTQMNQGAGLQALPSRNKEGVGDCGPLSCRPTSCCHSISRVWSAGTLFWHTRDTVSHSWLSTCLHLKPSQC